MDFDVTLGMAVLERTPATLHALLHGLSPAWADATEGPETWSLYVIVRHLILGERTNWVAHDLGHVAQAARVMAKQYREAVGPWQAYLPILTR
jgi:hypothetical protein